MSTQTASLRGGPDTIEFLATSGFPAVTPGIRSSDYEHGLANPFSYYLRRRLGLSPFLDYSDALSHGSWFHTRAELIGEPDNRASGFMEAALVAREAEIKVGCDACGAGHDMQREFIERERNDRDTAWAWFDAARHIVTPDGTFVDYLANPDWETIGREVIIELDHPDFPGTPLIAQFDVLQYNADINAIRIPDYKTTRIFPEVRMISCPAEFQTWHYMMVLHLVLTRKYSYRIRTNRESNKQDLTALLARHRAHEVELEVSTMDHIIVQKPIIRFGQKDRDYNYIAEGKRKKVTGTIVRGDNGMGWIVNAEDTETSQPLFPPFPTMNEDEAIEMLHEAAGKKPEKVHHGEPSRDRYLDRVRDWYNGTDDESKAERAMHCPVVISRTSMLDLHEQQLYYDRVRGIHDLATREPYPDNFQPAPSKMIDYSRPSIMAPFYVMSPSSWPSLITQNKILVRHRDPQ